MLDRNFILLQKPNFVSYTHINDAWNDPGGEGHLPDECKQLWYIFVRAPYLKPDRSGFQEVGVECQHATRAERDI